MKQAEKLFTSFNASSTNSLVTLPKNLATQLVFSRLSSAQRQKLHCPKRKRQELKLWLCLTTVYRCCSAYQTKVAEASRKLNDTKYSLSPANSRRRKNREATPHTEKIVILVAEVLSKKRSVYNNMSYSDVINIVSNSPSRIFNNKLTDKKYTKASKAQT